MIDSRIVFGWYGIGALGCFFVLLLLFLHPVSRQSLSLPDGSNPANPWIGSDVMTYVAPAKTFLESGEFLRKGQPDLHRTVGYPFFLAVMMRIFGENWTLAVLIVQGCFFACLFPAGFLIAELWFPGQRRCNKFYFLLLFICGVGLAYMGQILTDQIFSALFLLGLASGLLAVVRGSWVLTIFHIIVLSSAAQIRPTLALFWVAEFFLLLYTANQWGVLRKRKTIWIIGISVVLLAITGNGPSIRNYMNHGIFTPTDIFSNNLAFYLAGPVKISAGDGESYRLDINKLSAISNDKQRIIAQEKYAFKTFREYPIETVKRVLYHVYWNLFEPHWEYIGFVFHKGFSLNSMLDDNGNLKNGLLWSLPFAVIYCFLYLLVLSYSLTLLRKKEWCLIIGLLVVFMPLFASFINGQGARMRLYVEPLILLFALCEGERLLKVMKED